MYCSESGISIIMCVCKFPHFSDTIKESGFFSTLQISVHWPRSYSHRERRCWRVPVVTLWVAHIVRCDKRYVPTCWTSNFGSVRSIRLFMPWCAWGPWPKRPRRARRVPEATDGRLLYGGAYRRVREPRRCLEMPTHLLWWRVLS